MSSNRKYKVAVLTLCYNTGDFVSQAITSLINQRFYTENKNSIQHLILDDASTDNSVQLINDKLQKCSHNYNFITNESNEGITHSCNKLFNLIDAEYYCFLSDDLWDTEFLTSNIMLLDSLDAETGVVYSDVKEIDENNEIISNSFFSKYKIFNTPSGHAYEENIKRNFIPAISAMVRYECANAIGGYDTNLPTEDVDFWLRLLREFKCYNNPKNLVYYRRHMNSVTVSQRYDMAEYKLLTYNKHWGFTPKVDRLLLDKATQFIIACLYKDVKSEEGLMWLDKYVLSTKAMDFRILKSLIQLPLPTFITKMYLRLMLKYK